MKVILMKYVFLSIILLCLVIISNLIFGNIFKSGQCIKDHRDGYIWHINRYTRGTYYLMGWQSNSWGNPVEMRKDILERKDLDDIQIYNQTACPELNPN